MVQIAGHPPQAGPHWAGHAGNHSWTQRTVPIPGRHDCLHAWAVARFFGRCRSLTDRVAWCVSRRQRFFFPPIYVKINRQTFFVCQLRDGVGGYKSTPHLLDFVCEQRTVSGCKMKCGKVQGVHLLLPGWPQRHNASSKPHTTDKNKEKYTT